MQRRPAYVRRDIGEIAVKRREARERGDEVAAAKAICKNSDHWLASRGLNRGKVPKVFVEESNARCDSVQRFRHKRQPPCECRSLLAAIVRSVAKQARDSGLVTTPQDRREFLLQWKATIAEARDTHQERAYRPRAATVARQAISAS